MSQPNPYPQPVQPSAPYAQHPGAYGAAYQAQPYRPPGPKGMSITSMILGIASFFFGWTFLVPIAGLILGFIGLRKEPDGKGFAITGVVLNGIMLLAWGVGVIVSVVLFLATGAAILPFLFYDYGY